MMKQAAEISLLKEAMTLKYGEEKLNDILKRARKQLNHIKVETGVNDEIAIIKTNIKTAKSPEAKAVWIIMLGE